MNKYADHSKAAQVYEDAHSRRRWLTDCGKKRRYKTRELADTVATDAQEKRGVGLRVYECPHCLGWHLTRAGVQ